MGLELIIPEGFILTTTLEQLVNWGRSRSPWPLLFGLACCAIEMMVAGASRNDISRFGAEVFRGSPRQADVMIVAGRISQKMAPVVKRLYDQMPEPKWIIAMGACASSGGMFNNYAIVQVQIRSSPSMSTSLAVRLGLRLFYMPSPNCKRRSRVRNSAITRRSMC